MDDLTTYLEMARLAIACIPEVIEEEMDISDDEFVRLREALHERLNPTNKS